MTPAGYTLITSAPPPTTTSRSATFGLAPGQRYECKLNGDGGGWAPCSGSVTYTGLDTGNQAFHVRPVGDEGGPRPENYHWTVVEPSAPMQVLAAVQRAVGAVNDARDAIANGMQRPLQMLLHSLALLAAAALSLLRRLFH